MSYRNMWKAQVRNLTNCSNLTNEKICQHIFWAGKNLPTLVDNIGVEGRMEPGVGGEHGKGHVGSFPENSEINVSSKIQKSGKVLFFSVQAI